VDKKILRPKRQHEKETCDSGFRPRNQGELKIEEEMDLYQEAKWNGR